MSLLLKMNKVDMLACTIIALAALLVAWDKRRHQRKARARDAIAKQGCYTIIKDYQPFNPKWLISVKADPSWINQGLREIRLQGNRTAMQSQSLTDEPSPPSMRFALKPSFTYLNHGSYGATFSACLRLQSWWRERMEEHPVRFMEAIAMPSLFAAMATLEAIIAPQSDSGSGVLLPVVNSTQAANCVISSVLDDFSSRRDRSVEKDPIVIFTNLTYPAVKSTIMRESRRTGAHALMINIHPEDLIKGSSSGILRSLQSALDDFSGHPMLVVLDHLVSFPPVILPVEAMTNMCKEKGAVVFIDGAHAIGSISALDVPSIGADFYCSNLHKWISSPKGAAFLWASDKPQDLLKPLAISHGYKLGLMEEFIWTGTQDLTAWLSLPAALKELEELGGMDYVATQNSLGVQRAGRMLIERWGLLLMEGESRLRSVGGAVDLEGENDSNSNRNSNRNSFTCPMIGIELPPRLVEEISSDHAAGLNLLLRERFEIEVPVACWAGAMWVRLSYHLGYNTFGDYERLAEAIETVMSERRSRSI